jgi:hypothetical protein
MDLRAPGGESPIGAWATWDRLTDRRAYDRAGTKTRTNGGRTRLAGYQVRFLRRDSGVRWWQKRTPEGWSLQGSDAPSAHRRPGYSLSGCTPAESDPASPGGKSLAELLDRHKVSGPQAVRLGSRARVQPNRARLPARTRRCTWGKDAPKEGFKKNENGRPRGKSVDFFLLIGALRLRVLRTHTLSSPRRGFALVVPQDALGLWRNNVEGFPGPEGRGWVKQPCRSASAA